MSAPYFQETRFRRSGDDLRRLCGPGRAHLQEAARGPRRHGQPGNRERHGRIRTRPDLHRRDPGRGQGCRVRADLPDMATVMPKQDLAQMPRKNRCYAICASRPSSPSRCVILSMGPMLVPGMESRQCCTAAARSLSLALARASPGHAGPVRSRPPLLQSWLGRAPPLQPGNEHPGDDGQLGGLLLFPTGPDGTPNLPGRYRQSLLRSCRSHHHPDPPRQTSWRPRPRGALRRPSANSSNCSPRPPSVDPSR